MANCKCAILFDKENNQWCCSVIDDKCIYKIPDYSKCYNAFKKKKGVD